MSDPTAPPTHVKLFEEGDYYITPVDGRWTGFDRNSMIIHNCGLRHDFRPHGIMITMPHGRSSPCYYCKQDVPEALKALYILHNFDCIAGDKGELEIRGHGTV